jgi:hypothetical protein
MRRYTALFFALSLVAFASESTFEGKWKLDKKATSTGDGPEIREVEIEREGGEIVIKSKYVEPKHGVYPLPWLGIMAYELRLNSDGSDTVNILGPYKHQSKTTIDGNKLVTEFVAANEAGEAVKGQWVRTVSADGKQMTCQIRTETKDGRTLDQTLVFRRK